MENKKVSNYKIGDLIKFKDGEVWKVVEHGVRNPNSRRQPNELTVAPDNEIARANNVSLAIDMGLDYINENAA